jgi:hypothetical protein
VEASDDPTKPYEKEWKGFGDWLGTGAISTHDREHLTFEEAWKYVRSLKLGMEISFCNFKLTPKQE